MSKKSRLTSLLAIAAIFTIKASCAAGVVVPMYMTDAAGQGKSIGTITMEGKACGVLFIPNLHNLPAGIHGFHIHENPTCGDKGMAAGGHLDPAKTGNHEGPYASGHLGDLPVLIVDQNGSATIPTLAPKLKLSNLKGHALMIHINGDNYSDTPEKLGGGGARMACGVIG